MKIKRKLLPVVAPIFLASFLVLPAAAQKTQRITFARGATVARATGYLRGIRDEAFFVLRASAGQHMRVEIKGAGATRGSVIFPSGREDGQPGGVIFDDNIDETGDYRIRVTESQMAESWRGSFSIKVEILRRGQSGPGSSNLGRYAGKYPSEMFRREAGLKTKLRQLLGNANYREFFDRMQTEMPIEKDGNAIVARGCMAHQCTIEEAILVVNLADGTPFVAIKFNSRFRTFTGGMAPPQALRNAMQN
jgi:hypothetical protein